MTETQTTKRLILMLAAIAAVLVGASVAVLIYLNYSIDRISGVLFQDVDKSHELILNADRDLYQSSLALYTLYTSDGRDRLLAGSQFENNVEEASRRVNAAAGRLSGGKPYESLRSNDYVLEQIRSELAGFAAARDEWLAAGRNMLASGDPAATPPSSLNKLLDNARGHLDRSEDLLSRYGDQVMDIFKERKSSLFAVYSLMLIVLFLFIFYLGRRMLFLQKQRQEESGMYQLIGESMTDFILLTDANGSILYASPSHLPVLGYTPKTGAPLSQYIREPDIAWAKLKNAASGSSASKASELRMRSADGHWVWMETKVSAITGSESYPARFMLVSREITQRKQHEERLHKLAFYDHLTSIPNRAHFKMYMENLFSQPKDNQTLIALALLDCDRFKQLNDTLGHLAGDEFLQLLSGQLQQTVKGVGQAFRIGGDEFAVVLHRFSSPEMLEEILDRLLKLFNKTWSINNGSSFHTSASIGVALYPKHGKTINELLRAADLAMYRSKDHGGNEATLYTPAMDGDPGREERAANRS
ncbi:sensor domain-containing diguanylate cyclase [Paenibacillus spiritus]|uniref:sensor domain-containing diguanylate cyclase n=1 Tax=Paenibacillus spiritus TaxID=2496557 RepID=UPI00168A6FD7|nr:sensor domain-containing diguanylate cyclase [Paenibacillus spiritus]